MEIVLESKKHHRHLQLPLINGADFPEALGATTAREMGCVGAVHPEEIPLTTVILTHSLLAFSAGTLSGTRNPLGELRLKSFLRPLDGFEGAVAPEKGECIEEAKKQRRGRGWFVGWGLTALLTQNRSYRASKFVGIFHSKRAG